MLNKFRINDQIRCPIVLVLQDERKLGTFTTDEAKKIAKAAGLDLVEVAPQSKPPVCRIMDFGKFKYEQSIKEKEQKKKQKQQHHDKELRLSPAIGEHDLEVKINVAKKFLLKGHNVYFSLRYKRRENAHKELGFKVVDKIILALEEFGAPQSKPRLDGSSLNFIIEPKNDKKS